jgi:SMI1 / KNR4 family (SUKH-1)
MAVAQQRTTKICRAQQMPFDPAERFIRAAEEELGAPLPHSYRQVMMASNGGDVAAYSDVWNLYPILDKSDRKRVSRSCNDILRETRRLRDWPDWPENAVAIAHNGTDDKLLFLRGGRLYHPEVYVWLHDTGDLIVVAQSFSELRRAV